jgi:hypothetical protein
MSVVPQADRHISRMGGSLGRNAVGVAKAVDTRVRYSGLESVMSVFRVDMSAGGNAVEFVL